MRSDGWLRGCVWLRGNFKFLQKLRLKLWILSFEALDAGLFQSRKVLFGWKVAINIQNCLNNRRGFEPYGLCFHDEKIVADYGTLNRGVDEKRVTIKDILTRQFEIRLSARAAWS